MCSSLVWPDLSPKQGIIAFGISGCTKEGLVQFTGQNGSVAPQKCWGNNWQYMLLISHHGLVLRNPSNSITIQGGVYYYLYCQLSPQDFCGAT